jgi:phosphatidylglycerophosphatase A
MKTKVAGALATWFGCGLSPFAPGTVGSLAAVVIAYLLGWPPWCFAVLGVAFTPIGIWAADVTARVKGKKDPGLVVIDEVVGQWITIAGASTLNWKALVAAFLLFRVLDIVKPPPARQFERLPGGLGIMADDIAAGIYGAMVLVILDTTPWFRW